MDKFRVLAPTRVDLAGGTLDLWPLYSLVGESKTINMAINLYAVAEFEVSPSPTFTFQARNHHSGETTEFYEPLTWEHIPELPHSVQFPAAIASEFFRQKPHLPPLSIKLTIRSEAPLRSGLGGSSSLCVAIVRGLARLTNDFVDQGWQWKMLTWVRDVEASFLKTATGTQDYLAALFGGLKCYLSRTGGIECLPYPDGVLEAVSERTVTLFSGVMHNSGISNWEIYKGALEGNAGILYGLRELRTIADQLDSELRGHLSWKHIGQSFNEEWKVRKQLFQVETPRLEEILQFLRTQKIYGAKVCGAAQGGSLIALVEPKHREALVAACQRAGIDVLSAKGVASNVSTLRD